MTYEEICGLEEQYSRNAKIRKDTTRMDDVKLVIGGREYEPFSVTWIQDTDLDFPRIEVEAVVNPSAQVLSKRPQQLTITNVIFNPPATIVFWSDGTKSVVKCNYEHEEYDPEKGIAMAIARKMIGDNKYEYYNVFRHWLKKWEKQHRDAEISANLAKFFGEMLEDIMDEED